MDKNQLIQKMKWAVDIMVLAIDAAFFYGLLKLFQIADKPFVVLLAVAILNVLILAGLQLRDGLAMFPKFQRILQTLCRPYLRLEEMNAGIWEMFGDPVENGTLGSPLYQKFCYLPALPLNLVLSTVILLSSWNTFMGTLFTLIMLWLILTIGGLLSYLIVEVIFRTTSRLMLKALSHINRHKE